MDDSSFVKITDGKVYDKKKICLSEDTLERLNEYTLQKYIQDVETIGLEMTWNHICQFVIDNNGKVSNFLDTKNFGELYEIGLATQDKLLKKKRGQYYTPDDVAEVMSQWLKECDGSVVCDVACGTGKLILTYLDLIGYDASRELISKGNLYLYDFDNVALKICWTAIAVKYGLDIADSIHDIFCDFLDRTIVLPPDCKVISNPPYSQIDEIQDYWEHTNVLYDTKELYSAFMEKIFQQAKSTVIITPFSFISGNKFFTLRKEMCEVGNGFIVAFDNVPGNIFSGKKHGIFNTNTANSVRAAITVLSKNDKNKGFRVSPLIRFKNEERKDLLKIDVLEKILPQEYQIITTSNQSFRKIQRELQEVYKEWVAKSSYTLKDFISKNDEDYMIDIPNTCRYFTVASGRKLRRTGSITIKIHRYKEFAFAYCLINSSFAYWWWRIFDGGITYPVSLLNDMPLPYNLLTNEDKDFFANLANEMIAHQDDYIVTKMNAGAAQENIKFPDKYRIMINDKLLSILGFDLKSDIFDGIHANKFFVEQ